MCFKYVVIGDKIACNNLTSTLPQKAESILTPTDNKEN